MLGVIYKATSKTSGKSYIGQTIRFEKRKAEHLQAKDNYAFHLALQKYGAEDFEWTILEKCEREKLDEREIYWIAQYDSYYNGYNSTKGGDNANALLNWQQNNQDKMIDNAMNGLQYANKYNKEHRAQHLENLAKAREKGIEKVKKKVLCVDLNLLFNSLSDAERWSISSDNPNGRKASHQHISKVCKGQRNTAGGYAWKYVSKGE